jgi:hypothetical protein
MKPIGAIALVPLALLMVGSAAQAVPINAENAATLKYAIEARGWYCPKPETIERTEIDHYGNKIYRIRCSNENGGDGPSYKYVITRDGRQLLGPWQ